MATKNSVAIALDQKTQGRQIAETKRYVILQQEELKLRGSVCFAEAGSQVAHLALNSLHNQS